MSLLEKLWDDTVAGPRPDSGLGKLRKFNTFNFRSTSGKDMDGADNSSTNNQEAMKVTRSIMIVKPPGYNTGAGSAPVSPAGSLSPTTPTSPFSRNRPRAFRFRRGCTTDAYEKAANEDGACRSPPPPQDVRHMDMFF